MNAKRIVAIATLTVAAASMALAQNQAPQKVSKADVQKVLDGIKGNPTKMEQFCDMAKLEKQGDAIAEKNQNDPKLDTLGKQIDEISAKLGPDFENAAHADLEDASRALFDDLAKSCK
jgi:ABC-type transporter MlaC component